MSYTVLVLGKLYKLERCEYRDRASRVDRIARHRVKCVRRERRGSFPFVSPSLSGDPANYTRGPKLQMRLPRCVTGMFNNSPPARALTTAPSDFAL